MPTRTLSAKGQVTIPKEIRDRLGLRKGDRMRVELDERGYIVLRPEARDPLGRLPGLLRRLAPRRPVTLAEMDETVRGRANARSRRTQD